MSPVLRRPLAIFIVGIVFIVAIAIPVNVFAACHSDAWECIGKYPKMFFASEVMLFMGIYMAALLNKKIIIINGHRFGPLENIFFGPLLVIAAGILLISVAVVMAVIGIIMSLPLLITLFFIL